MMSNVTYSETAQRAATCELVVKNQFLISRTLDLGFITEARQLQRINRELFYFLEQTRKPFDFIRHIADGNILLVDEGNLSFALSHRINPSNITASTFKKASTLSDADRRKYR